VTAGGGAPLLVSGHQGLVEIVPGCALVLQAPFH
jgi:hypothetical protein